MDVTQVPATIYVAIGATLAAVITGFFSFVNLVSAKENKVSEFRLAWIDGLRNEIATYSSAIQELARVHSANLYSRQEDHDDETYNKLKREKYEKTRETYANAQESLTKIQLRLNQKHIKEDPKGDEAKLMGSILKARANFNNAEYFEAYQCCSEISATAAPLLKSTWDLVKNGEHGYRKIRNTTSKSIRAGLILIIALILLLSIATIMSVNAENKKTVTESFQLCAERFNNESKTTDTEKSQTMKRAVNEASLQAH